ncbi:serine/threonine-protein kinase [Isoptericola sp. BMS4]|uniref:serine/threonine-protein kinase n=1 Tax=Isoptericola sp. BMS4 TaxID=2527875 RepID=UPI00141EE8BB|nr:serine/threonine-protein kinase [Isoptericola sp. BMS4]
MRPTTGLALGDRYRLTRQIAVGGMGEVWVADDGFLGREVAVKVLREEYTGNEDFLRRLRTEARNSAALSHPNIAQMYDYGEQDGTGYLVMELVLGEPLADLLEREPVVAPRKLLPILAATARGLHHAHLAQVVHRDVKPGNILLEHGGGVKITDFGVSLAANQAPMTATGMVMGTAQYLSPEQAVGQAATPSSDIYALGVVAYEATAGKRPFTGSTPVDIAVAHVNATVPPLPSHVHPELAALVERMLEKDPGRRPASAAELAQELDVLAREIAQDPLGARSRSARRVAARGGSRPPRAVPAHAAPAPGAEPPTQTAGEAIAEEADPTRYGPVGTVASPPAPSTPTSPSGHVPTQNPFSPVPSQPGAPSGTGPSDTPVDGERPAGRAYPPRRDRHGGPSDARRPLTRRGAAAARRPAEPQGRGGSRSASSRTGGKRTSTTTGQRFGPLGRLSWPLLALLALLLVLLLATLVRSLSADDAASAAGIAMLITAPRRLLSPYAATAGPTSDRRAPGARPRAAVAGGRTTCSTTANEIVPSDRTTVHASITPADGMMHRKPSRAPRATTTEKDD